MALGSWPQRKEFTYEALNRADTAVMSMRVRVQDNKSAAEAKIMTAQAYAFRLVQRALIEQYVFDSRLYINAQAQSEDAVGTAVLRITEDARMVEQYKAYKALKDKLVLDILKTANTPEPTEKAPRGRPPKNH